jgi:hypothetical protein
MVYGKSLRSALGRKLREKQVGKAESCQLGHCLVELTLFSHSKLINP